MLRQFLGFSIGLMLLAGTVNLVSAQSDEATALTVKGMQHDYLSYKLLLVRIDGLSAADIGLEPYVMQLEEEKEQNADVQVFRVVGISPRELICSSPIIIAVQGKVDPTSLQCDSLPVYSITLPLEKELAYAQLTWGPSARDVVTQSVDIDSDLSLQVRQNGNSYCVRGKVKVKVKVYGRTVASGTCYTPEICVSRTRPCVSSGFTLAV